LQKTKIESPSFNAHNKQLKKNNRLNIVLFILFIICLFIIVIFFVLPSIDMSMEQKKDTILVSDNDFFEVIRLYNDSSEVTDSLTITDVKSTSKKQNKEDKFKIIIGKILSSLEKNKITNAQKYLQQAKSIYPDKALLKELSQRIDYEDKINKIKNIIKMAANEEKNEQWINALALYNDILVIDSNNNKVLVNRQRVKKYIEINQLLSNIINHPERLNDRKILAEKKQKIKKLKQKIKEKNSLIYSINNTPRLNNKISAVEQILNTADIPVKLIIRSDNLTDIMIYKVRHLGRLDEQQIGLRPGYYTLVGSREGYRDIRKKIKISSKDKNSSIVIKCKEKI